MSSSQNQTVVASVPVDDVELVFQFPPRPCVDVRRPKLQRQNACVDPEYEAYEVFCEENASRLRALRDEPVECRLNGKRACVGKDAVEEVLDVVSRVCVRESLPVEIWPEAEPAEAAAAPCEPIPVDANEWEALPLQEGGENEYVPPREKGPQGFKVEVQVVFFDNNGLQINDVDERMNERISDVRMFPSGARLVPKGDDMELINAVIQLECDRKNELSPEAALYTVGAWRTRQKIYRRGDVMCKALRKDGFVFLTMNGGEVPVLFNQVCAKCPDRVFKCVDAHGACYVQIRREDPLYDESSDYESGSESSVFVPEEHVKECGYDLEEYAMTVFYLLLSAPSRLVVSLYVSSERRSEINKVIRRETGMEARDFILWLEDHDILDRVRVQSKSCGVECDCGMCYSERLRAIIALQSLQYATCSQAKQIIASVGQKFLEHELFIQGYDKKYLSFVCAVPLESRACVQNEDWLKSEVRALRRQNAKLEKAAQRQQNQLQREIEKEKMRRQRNRKAAAEKKAAEVQSLFEFDVGSLFPNLNRVASELNEETLPRMNSMFDEFKNLATSIGKKFQIVEDIDIIGALSGAYLLYTSFKAGERLAVAAAATMLSKALGIGPEILVQMVSESVSVLTRQESAPEPEAEATVNSLVDIAMSFVDTATGGVSDKGWLMIACSGIISVLTYMCSKRLPSYSDFSTFFSNFGRMSTGIKSARDFYGWFLNQLYDVYYRVVCGKTLDEVKMLESYPELSAYIAAANMISNSDLRVVDRSAIICKQIINVRNALTEIKVRAQQVRQTSIVTLVMHVLASMQAHYLAAIHSPATVDKTRDEPFAILLASDKAGVGKTIAQKMIASEIYRTYIKDLGYSFESSVFTRRSKNEYWEGYLCPDDGQHIVIYDDWGQVQDTISNPNPELEEFIAVKNTADFHLNMATLENKSSTYFKSKYVLLSSNQVLPNVKSLVSKDAIRRRIDYAVEVSVKPEYGVRVSGRNEEYYKYDKNVAAEYRRSRGLPQPEGGLATDQYLFRVYSPMDGTTLHDNMGWDEMIALMHLKVREHQENHRSLHDQIRVLAGNEAQNHESDRDLEKKMVEACQVDVDALIQELDMVHPRDWFQRKLEKFTLKTSQKISDVTGSMGEFVKRMKSRVNLETFDPIGDTLAAAIKSDEESGAMFERPVSEVFCTLEGDRVPERREALRKVVVQANDEFQDAVNDMDLCGVFDIPDEVSQINISYARCLFVGFYKSSSQMVTKVVKQFVHAAKWVSDKARVWWHWLRDVVLGLYNNHFGSIAVFVGSFLVGILAKRLAPKICPFWLSCEGAPCVAIGHNCDTCSKLNLTSNWREELLTYAQYFATDAGQQSSIAVKVAAYPILRWALRVQSAESRTTGARSIARVESAESRTTGAKSIARVESGESKTFGSRPKIRVEGDEELTVQSEVTFEKLMEGRPVQNTLKVPGDLVRVDQANATVCHNGVTLIFTRSDIGGRYTAHATFLRGRICMTNRHGIPSEWDYVQVFNPFQVINKTKIPKSEVKISLLNDIAGRPVDLALLEFPNCVASRKSIVSKFCAADQMPFVNNGTLFLDGLKLVKGVPIMFSKSTSNFALQNSTISASSHDGKDSYTYNRCWVYEIATSTGESGGILTTSCTLCPSKIVGIHAAGVTAMSQGVAVPTSREFIERVLEEHVKKHGTPDANFIDSAVPFCTQSAEEIVLPPGVKIAGTGQCIHLGNAPIARASSQTKVKKSAISGVLGEPKSKPAHLAPFEMNGKIIEPHENASQKLLTSKPFIPVADLKRAFQEVRTQLGQPPKDSIYRKTLTVDEAITGVLYDEMKSISRAPSQGYPTNQYNKDPSKKDLLGREGDYVIDPQLRQAVLEALELCKKGVRPQAIWQAMLKDERRPNEKVDAGKTRQIYAGWIVTLVLHRMLFGGFAAWAVKNRIKNSSCLGVNPYSLEWGAIKRHLQEVGDNLQSNDWQNFDGNAPGQVVNGICEYLINPHYDDGPENNRTRTTAWDMVAAADILIRDEVIRVQNSHPSGSFFTTLINTFSNDVYHCLAFNYGKKKFGLLGASYQKMTRRAIFGDDILLSVHADVKDWYNFEFLHDFFRDHLDMVYTTSDKKEESVGWMTMDEVDFLKRKFITDKNGYCRGPLSMDTIREMLNWVRGGAIKQATAQVVGFALRELSVHGEEVYNECANKIWNACQEAGVECYPPTYDDWNDCWMYENGMFGPKMTEACVFDFDKFMMQCM